jgi:hypothetical protein
MHSWIQEIRLDDLEKVVAGGERLRRLYYQTEGKEGCFKLKLKDFCVKTVM